jgi:thiopeptide-type bacteriocin biosynthesis protein
MRSSLWQSVHIYAFEPVYGDSGDHLIRMIAAPLVASASEANLISQFFFVRYNDPKPHIRLRLKSRRGVPERLLRLHIRTRLRSFLARGATADAKRVDNIAWVPYEPEIDRYGGRDAIRVAERCFHVSSQTVLTFLNERSPLTRSDRLGTALLLYLASLHPFQQTRAELASVAGIISRGYLSSVVRQPERRAAVEAEFDHAFQGQREYLFAHVRRAHGALEAKENLGAVMPYVRVVQSCAGKLRALRQRGMLTSSQAQDPSALDREVAIAQSYAHMTCNRLGLTVMDESYVAGLVAACLRSNNDDGNAHVVGD